MGGTTVAVDDGVSVGGETILALRDDLRVEGSDGRAVISTSESR
jgi:hypothetical protein